MTTATTSAIVARMVTARSLIRSPYPFTFTVPSGRFLLSRRRLEVARGLVVEGVALILEKLEIRLLMPVENHVHLPRAREHLQVLDLCFIVNVVGIQEVVPFYHMQLLAVVVSHSVEPGFVVEVDNIHHERIAIPRASGITHPPLDRAARMRCVHEDVPNRMFVLEEHHHRGRRLRNLKRERLLQGFVSAKIETDM